MGKTLVMMTLLDRVAHSEGDRKRTLLALRLINDRLARELGRDPFKWDQEASSQRLWARVQQANARNTTRTTDPN
jgi:hypothetical protein